MEVKTETQTIVKTVYIAEDGKRFDSESTCKSYEDDLQYDKLEKRFFECRIARCPEIDKLFDFFDVMENGDSGAGWFIFKTDEEIEIAQQYARYTGCHKQIGIIEKDTPYLVMDYNLNTRWFKEKDVEALQRSFSATNISEQ